MATLHVAPGDWASFCKAFSLAHTGWLVKLEVMGSRLGAQIEADGVPLEGISVEHDHGAPDIEITVGKVTHTIAHATNVWLKTSNEGADETLEIESPETVTLLTFRSALPSERVDGVSHHP